jgi:nucleotide-binding universal stress UspA family protein
MDSAIVGSAASRILVPLDGSELAEHALPAAAHIARATNRPLVLARITPIMTWGDPFGAPLPEETVQQLADEEQREAAAYLEQIARSLRPQGLTLQTSVGHGDPASALLELASALQASLIVMTSHGRTGLARVALGSVADRLVRDGHVPVLLVHVFAAAERAGHLDHAVVPLDGSALAESALDMAVSLAGPLLQRITLLRAIAAEATSEQRAAAQQYLDRQRTHLQQQLAGRSCAVSALTRQGPPAAQIRRQAEADAALVIMATRGETGLRRWALGSVADQVLKEARGPVLLVHPRLSRSLVPGASVQGGTAS